MAKTPFLTLEKAQEIIKDYPTPFHIYDEAGIRANVKALVDAFSWNAGYKEYFAVKAAPNPFLMKILQEYGCGCDCSSKTELMLSKSIGATGDNIMFSSNDTPIDEFKFCNDLGGIINLDDITHIELVEKACGKLPQKMSCRYNPGGVFILTNGIMDNPGDAKYGMTKEQIFEAFTVMKSKGVKEFGLHSFLASNTVTNEYYPELARVLFNLAVEIKEKTGISVSFI
ncbi:MAG: diaminopimelate decarboxylase, partial [Eubacterium sp.]|nr:diaminopimelate decarboxylase [Eubacterium sp.]